MPDEPGSAGEVAPAATSTLYSPRAIRNPARGLSPRPPSRESGTRSSRSTAPGSLTRRLTVRAIPHLTNVLVYLIENARPDDSGVRGIRLSSRSVCNPSL